MIPLLADGPSFNVVTQAIQLAIAPVFLLAGIGAFLNVCVGRLARIIDRARLVEERLLAGAAGSEHDRLVYEINRLDQRMRVVNQSIFLAVASGVAVCAVVCLLFLAALIRPPLGPAIALLFILTMLLLMAALGMFLVEVRLASRAIRVRDEVLQHEAPDPSALI